ncbi:histidine--tRNA ligase [Filifactor alocis]
MQKLSSKPAKGTQDLLPQDMKLRNWVTKKIIEAYTSRGYTQIETPMLENLDNLTNSEGGENLRMIFKVLKRGEKLDWSKAQSENDLSDLGLRFDLTLPLSRFYANNMNELTKPFKAFQIGNVFRAERNQKGRYRQFVQCDIDTLGDSGIYAEIDLMLTVPKALYNIGFKDFVIKINDRRILKDLVIDAGFAEEDFETVCITADKKDKIGEEGVVKELLEKGYAEETIKRFLENLTTPLEQLTTPYAEDLKLLTSIISKYYPIQFDATLVRGMGYYTGPIFEIETPKFGGAVAGGGRYDGLLNKFSKESIPAVGFSIGFERIIGILKDQNFVVPEERETYAILFVEDSFYEKALTIANEKIEQGNIASIYKIKSNRIGKEVANFKKSGYEVIVADEQ